MKKILFLLLLVVISFLSVSAQDIPEPMQPKRLVNDFAGIFKEENANVLERTLRLFNDSTSTQITVVTVTTLDGYAIADYAQRLAQKWGIGRKGKDNGILVLVKAKTAEEKGDVNISVGYGLEGVVTDIASSRIIHNEMIPRFRENNYYQGVADGVKVLMDLSRGEYTADQYADKDVDENRWSIITIIVIFILVFIIACGKNKNNGNNNGGNRNSHGGGGMPFIFFGGMGGGHSSGGSWGSFSGGSGGFGGFGGGSFGGGGASGSW